MVQSNDCSSGGAYDWTFWLRPTSNISSLQATDADAEKKHTREIEEQITKIAMAMQAERANETEQQTLERAMRDPEVAVSIWARCCYRAPTYCSHVRVEHYERPGHATDPSASAEQPCSSAGPYEEPDRAGEDSEACRGRHHSHALREAWGHTGRIDVWNNMKYIFAVAYHE
jgi:hypothetical protein